jgi:23S rRNA (uracil1939-C5)-methyltransferase
MPARSTGTKSPGNRAETAGSFPRPAPAGGGPGPAHDEVVRVEVTGLAPGGDAVGRQVGGATDGRVTFVPYAAPGELVEARVVRSRARVAWAELVGVVRPSAARVGPRCPLFGRCGGCQWQHVDDGIQRSSKGDIVARALGITMTEAKPVGPSYGYRERVRLAVGRDPEAPDVTAIGYRRRKEHALIDVPACPLLAPALDAALPAVRARAGGLPHGTEIALLLGQGDVVAGDLFGKGIRIAPAPQGGAGAAELAEIDLGDPAAWPDVAEPGGRPLLLPPRGFAQVSRAGNAALVAAVADALGAQPGRVLELYAGSGNFTRQLVASGAAVIASDGDLAAVARGRRNVPEADWRPADKLDPTLLPVDTVLVDPPREGLDERSLALAAAGRRLVYVSCDPQTLCRDMGQLLRRGLRFEGAVAFDLMPQTYHVEVVALFSRR